MTIFRALYPLPNEGACMINSVKTKCRFIIINLYKYTVYAIQFINLYYTNLTHSIGQEFLHDLKDLQQRWENILARGPQKLSDAVSRARKKKQLQI